MFYEDWTIADAVREARELIYEAIDYAEKGKQIPDELRDRMIDWYNKAEEYI